MSKNAPRNPNIALAIDLDWPYKHHLGILSGILEYARPRGWRCEFTPFLGFATARKKDSYNGIIGRASRELQRYALARAIPTVNVWVNSPARKLVNVLPDKIAAGELAADHFMAKGYRRFGFLGQLGDVNSRLLLEGFNKILAPRQLPTLELFVKEGQTSAAEWRELQDALKQWMLQWTYPTAILCSTDVLARYFVDHCLNSGLRIPQDVAVLGVGNTEITCDMSEPRLSSIEHGFERVGMEAAARLEQLMAGKCEEPQTKLILPAGLVARTSTDAFAVADADVEKALRVIQELSHKPVRVSSILAAVPLSRRTLERRFREVLGGTMHDEIARAHVERAKRLLVGSQQPLKWIATQSGFSSPQRLSKVFRDMEGVSPQEFRSRHGKVRHIPGEA